MEAQIGDNIVFESERVAQPAHNGVIEEVLKRRAAQPGDRRRSCQGPRVGRARGWLARAVLSARTGCSALPESEG
jgi:Domain of unknown function (DUF1918)